MDSRLDGRRFDDLARGLATAASRRRVLKVLAGGLLGGLAAPVLARHRLGHGGGAVVAAGVCVSTGPNIVKSLACNDVANYMIATGVQELNIATGVQDINGMMALIPYNPSTGVGSSLRSLRPEDGSAALECPVRVFLPRSAVRQSEQSAAVDSSVALPLWTRAGPQRSPVHGQR